MKTIILCCALTATAVLPAVGQLDEYQDLDQTLLSTVPDGPHATPSTQWLYSGAPAASTSGKDSAPPVIVQLTPTAHETLATMSEDLTVMTRVIERALDGKLGKEEKPTKMSVQMLLTGSGRSVRAMHIEGLGALFMIKVNCALMPPPEIEKTSAATAGSEWEQARREIIGIAAADDRVRTSRVDGRAQFREEQVEALKAALLSALKEGHNIRYLKADDLITLCVFGTGGGALHAATSAYPRISTRDAMVSSMVKSVAGTETSPTAPVAPSTGLVAPGSQAAGHRQSPISALSPSDSTVPEATASQGSAYRALTDARTAGMVAAVPVIIPRNSTLGQGTVLTIRVKKADVDAFGKDEVDLKTFQGRATINAYAGAGYDVASVNSWLRR